MAMELPIHKGYILSSFPIYSFPSDMSTSLIFTVLPYLSDSAHITGWHILAYSFSRSYSYLLNKLVTK